MRIRKKHSQLTGRDFDEQDFAGFFGAQRFLACRCATVSWNPAISDTDACIRMCLQEEAE